MRAIDKMFDDEGLNSREQGQLLSLLDKLWSESESERIQALQAHAPELMTHEEQLMRMVIDVIKASRDKQDLEYKLEKHDLIVELLHHRINDSFADDVIKAHPVLKSEIKDTVGLKTAAREFYETLYPEP